MPVSYSREYDPAFIFKNAHINTIFSALFEKVPRPEYRRERFFLPDGDFVDVDFLYAAEKTETVVLLCHGFEGSSYSKYMMKHSLLFASKGVDAAALNYRGCSGVPNITRKIYTVGDTGDIAFILERLAERYRNILLAGFSLGGNLVLKYLGDKGGTLDRKVKAAAAVSAACCPETCCRRLCAPENILYSKRFLKSLIRKVMLKKEFYPDIDLKKVARSSDIPGFDDCFTSAVYGYKNSSDYYRRSESVTGLKNIAVPVLIFNAADDPILSPECYPSKEAEQKSDLFLEISRYGGHVGFVSGKNSSFSLEKKIAGFLLDHLRREVRN